TQKKGSRQRRNPLSPKKIKKKFNVEKIFSLTTKIAIRTIKCGHFPQNFKNLKISIVLVI
ncbi:hypothetical protein, partial [Avibacterium paragallinarum]|uniref:hypothetical protein n=1 Tax=Avibacterium paragallinarum TaxID=728 RepID=UPI000D42720F